MLQMAIILNNDLLLKQTLFIEENKIREII